MNLILSTHNVTLTKAIEDHLTSRIDKLAKLERYALSARAILEHDRTQAVGQQFSCSIRLDVPGPDLFAEHSDADLYTAIDMVCKKVEQQIRKRHSKYKARNKKDAARGKQRLQDSGL